MWSKLGFLVAVLSCAISAHEEDLFCLNSNDGNSLCTPGKIPNGGALTRLVESIMAINIDRKGSKQMSPRKFDSPIPAADGVFSPNRKLDENTEFKFNFLRGPESLFKIDNFLYAAAANAIHRVDLKSGDSKIIYDGNAKCPPEKPCSRPLGIRIRNDRLLCADALQGLIEVDITTGESKVHIAVGTPINGVPLLFPDDIDVDWEKEIVYMSDGSTKWALDSWVMAVIESDPSSRIIQFDLKTSEAKVFAQNIRFANGVQISHDKKFLLVDEFSARQILKYSLEDTLPASAKPFTGLLPGNPDNIRPSLTGGYWVALPIARWNGTRNLLDELQARPDLTKSFGNSALTVGTLVSSMGTLLSNDTLRNFGHEMETGLMLLSTLPRNGMLLELDADGKILQTLQSAQLDGLTEVLEHDDGLFCGSFANQFILSVPKANFRNP